MKLTLDINKKELQIEEASNFGEVVKFMKKRFKGEWKEWKIVPQIQFINNYPWWTYYSSPSIFNDQPVVINTPFIYEGGSTSSGELNIQTLTTTNGDHLEHVTQN